MYTSRTEYIGVGWRQVISMSQVWGSLAVVVVMLFILLFVILFTCCCRRQCEQRARIIEASTSVVPRARHYRYGSIVRTSEEYRFVHHNRDFY